MEGPSSLVEHIPPSALLRLKHLGNFVIGGGDYPSSGGTYPSLSPKGFRLTQPPALG